MSTLSMLGFGVVLAAMGVFMYKSPRAIEVIRREPFSKWPWWREAAQLGVIGAVPEGAGLVLSGMAHLLHADVIGVFAFIAANLVVLGLWLARPKWARPYWIR
jgi:hypothetical protein